MKGNLAHQEWHVQNPVFGISEIQLYEISFKDQPDFPFHLRKIDGGCIPDFEDVNAKIVVDKDMPHSNDILPRDRCVRLSKFG